LWLEGEKPILGICLGMQMVNVVSGGTLIQDIPSQVAADVGHKGTNENLIVYHLVKIKPDSRLARLLNADEITVNSVHHQSAICKRRGREFKGRRPQRRRRYRGPGADKRSIRLVPPVAP